MLERGEAMRWLLESDPSALERLWTRADDTRRRHVGDDVHLRGLIEISNHCARQCHYCGIRAGNHSLPRYRMGEDEVAACARKAAEFGYGTVVLQAGEDPGLTCEAVASLVRRIKAESGVAVTLSLGERAPDELAAWREAGADRYLLRFETSNTVLFNRIHPPRPGQEPRGRVELLREMRGLGYEIGSGVMVGIPGQTWDDLADDLALFQELDLDMIGVGPYIPHPATPLGQERAAHELPGQVPADELTTYKMLALARLACPDANIPSTTALATLNLAEGRELGLRRGANVLMPNMTPPHYRRMYEIYPAKACVRETAEQCHGCMRRRVESIGRRVGKGPGTSPSHAARKAPPLNG